MSNWREERATAQVDAESPQLTGEAREAAIRRRKMELEFEALAAQGFPEPESGRLAMNLRGDFLARYCIKTCRDHLSVREALATLDPSSPYFEKLRIMYLGLAPPPPPTPIARPRFRLGDLGGNSLPKDNSFNNYRSGWQNWYYQDGQLVTRPSDKR